MLRGGADSLLFLQAKYIPSDARRERIEGERERERNIYDGKGSYICWDADLGNRIAARRLPVDERYILIERRTK